MPRIEYGFAFAFVDGLLVDAMRKGHWVLLDEINLASQETLQGLTGILDGQSLCLTEKGDLEQVQRHKDFRLFAAMNPPTDVGKKELPIALRSRFTEIYCAEMEDPQDLREVVSRYLSNVQADPGITNCQTWGTYVVPIPSNYFGQTIRLAFDFATDGSAPTIFRVDDIRFLATSPTSCNYSLNTNSYTLSGSQAGTFSNATSVSTTNNCSWFAQVTSGGSWLSTTSNGTGNGNVSISVTENTGLNTRIGTIDIEGQTLTIEQPSVSCDYSLTQSTYNCPDHKAANLINIALVNVSNGCNWDATVIEGSNWMVCNSDGSGNGTINIDVTANNTGQERTGTIVVESETLLVVQPIDFQLTGINLHLKRLKRE